MDPNKEDRSLENEQERQTTQESNVPETKKDELITDKSIEDPTRSSFGDRRYNRDGLNIMWLIIGIAIGAALGVAYDRVMFGVSLGVLLGLAMSIIRRRK